MSPVPAHRDRNFEVAPINISQCMRVQAETIAGGPARGVLSASCCDAAANDGFAHREAAC